MYVLYVRLYVRIIYYIYIYICLSYIYVLYGMLYVSIYVLLVYVLSIYVLSKYVLSMYAYAKRNTTKYTIFASIQWSASLLNDDTKCWFRGVHYRNTEAKRNTNK